MCDYCGGEFVPPVGDDGVQVVGDTKFKCPTCDGLLSEGELERREVLYCTNCRGMLIAIDEFMPLIETLRSFRDRPGVTIPSREAAPGKLPRLCPRCSQPMDNHPYEGPGNVVIDTCEACSVNWLDKGELQKIVAAPDHTYGEPV